MFLIHVRDRPLILIASYYPYGLLVLPVGIKIDHTIGYRQNSLNNLFGLLDKVDEDLARCR